MAYERVANPARKKPRKGRKDLEAAKDDPLDGEPARRDSYAWWTCEQGRDAAERAWSWCDRHRASATSDAMLDLIHEAIYRGRPLSMSRATTGGQYLLLRSGAMLNLNIVMSMVDTATARLTKRRPMPVISASNAGWSEKLFARRASRVLRNKIGGGEVERMSPRLIRDMCIRGDGVVRVARRDGDVSLERIPVHELVVDPFEAEHGGSRTVAHVRPMDRGVACARWLKYRDEIMEASAYARQDPWAMQAYQTSPTHDFVEIMEIWHLPSATGHHDGQVLTALRGGICISRCRYDRERLPFARCQWSPPTRGDRGFGLVEQLAGIQEQIDDILRDAREGLKHGSQLTVFVQRGANVDRHHLRARHPKVVEYDGVAPQYVAPNPVSEQAIRILMLLIEQAYQIAGISQMAAQSKNTLGANASGKAIDTLDDLQSDRFAHVEADYQQMRVELGRLIVDEARCLASEASGEYNDEFPEAPDPVTKKDLAPWIAEIDWCKIKIDSGAYELTLEPVNYLADSRAGRLSQVAELGKNGLIPDPSIQADLFDEPDLQRANRMILGPKHRLDKIMERLADPDEDTFELQPDQHMNLELGVLMAEGELNEAEAQDAPPEVLDRYRQWIELARLEIKRKEQGAGVPSLPGMLPANMGAAPNAATLMPGLAGGGPMGPSVADAGMPMQGGVPLPPGIS